MESLLKHCFWMSIFPQTWPGAVRLQLWLLQTEHLPATEHQERKTTKVEKGGSTVSFTFDAFDISFLFFLNHECHFLAVGVHNGLCGTHVLLTPCCSVWLLKENDDFSFVFSSSVWFMTCDFYDKVMVAIMIGVMIKGIRNS